MHTPKWVKDFYGQWGIYPIAGGCGGGDDEPPMPPARPTAEQVLSGSPRLSELDQMVRQYIGKSLTMPGEWGEASDVYRELLGYTPEQFQFPISDIQKALEAQQALQFEGYQKQLRPILANQGQLDSTYYANLVSDYLKGQQAQSYGTTADLLTQQALQNLQLSQWLPQFRADIAGLLGDVGSQKLGLDQYNLMLPLQTYIPGLENLYGLASGEADRQYQNLMSRYQYDLGNFQRNQQQRAGGMGAIGQIGGAALGALLAIPTGGLSMAAIPAMMGGAGLGASLGGMISPLWGGSGGGIDLGSALSLAQGTGAFGMKQPQLQIPDEWLLGTGSPGRQFNWDIPQFDKSQFSLRANNPYRYS